MEVPRLSRPVEKGVKRPACPDMVERCSHLPAKPSFSDGPVSGRPGQREAQDKYDNAA